MLAEAAQTNSDKAQVIAALRQASAQTGSDFHYLLGTAIRESGLKSQAQASTSSRHAACSSSPARPGSA